MYDFQVSIFGLRGAIKKLFFLLLVKKLSPPPPPPFLTTSVFSVKDFFDSAQTPPPFGEKWSKNYQFFI